jgi:putative membrane protein
MRAWLSETELDRLEGAVRDAERGTSAEIVVVLAGVPGPTPGWLLGPAAAALLLPVPLLLIWPNLPALTLWTWQLALAALGALVASVPPLRRALTPEAIRRERVKRIAQEQFFAQGLHLTAARTGVLMLVAPAERWVEVLADAGAPGLPPGDPWREGIDLLCSHAREGRLADGIATAVAALGRCLREHAPAPAGDRDELANRPIQL